VTVLTPTAGISATPDHVVSGGTATVTWTAENVNACTIDKNGVAWKTITVTNHSASGSAPDTITSQTTYVISCTNGASATAVAATATKVVNINPNFKEF